MFTETIYTPFDLEHGECSSCGEISDDILIDDGRCIYCIEEQKFFEETMKGV